MINNTEELIVFTIATILLFLIPILPSILNFTSDTLVPQLCKIIIGVFRRLSSFITRLYRKKLNYFLIRLFVYIAIAVLKSDSTLSVWSMVRYFTIIILITMAVNWIESKFPVVHRELMHVNLVDKYSRHFEKKRKLIPMVSRLEPLLEVENRIARDVSIMAPLDSTFTEPSEIFFAFARQRINTWPRLSVEIYRYNFITNESTIICEVDFCPRPNDFQVSLKASLVKGNKLYYLIEYFQTNQGVPVNLEICKSNFQLDPMVYNILHRNSSVQWNKNSRYTMTIVGSKLFILLNPDIYNRSATSVSLILLEFPEVDGRWGTAKNERIIKCPYYIDIESGHNFSHFFCFNVYEGFIAIDAWNGHLEYVCYDDKNRGALNNVHPQFFTIANHLTKRTVELYRFRANPNSLLYSSTVVYYQNYSHILKRLCIRCLLELGIPILIAAECHISMRSFRSDVLRYKLIMYSVLWFCIVIFWFFWYADDLRV